MLAIAGKEAPRLGSIEGCKLLGQQPSRLFLVIVRVGDQMDLDTALVAAHCDTYARTASKCRARNDSIYEG